MTSTPTGSTHIHMSTSNQCAHIGPHVLAWCTPIETKRFQLCHLQNRHGHIYVQTPKHKKSKHFWSLISNCAHSHPTFFFKFHSSKLGCVTFGSYVSHVPFCDDWQNGCCRHVYFLGWLNTHIERSPPKSQSLRSYGCTGWKCVMPSIEPSHFWFEMRGRMTRSNHWVGCIANVFGAADSIFFKSSGHGSSCSKIRVTLTVTCLAQLGLKICIGLEGFSTTSSNHPPPKKKLKTRVHMKGFVPS